MKEHSFLSEFNDDDVLSFQPRRVKHPEYITRLDKFRDAIRDILLQNIGEFLYEKLKSRNIETWAKYSEQSLEGGRSTTITRSQDWLQDGIDCQVLRLGSPAWQTGKIRIRISVDFYPDEPEIELDSGSNNNQAEPVIGFPLDDVRKSIS